MKQSENNERWPCKNTCVEHWKKKKKILNNQEMFGPTGYSGGKQVQSRWENQWLTNGKYSIHWWLKESPRMTLCTTVDIGGFGGYSRQKQKEAMEKKQGERAALFYTSPPTVCSLSQGCQIKTDRNGKKKGKQVVGKKECLLAQPVHARQWRVRTNRNVDSTAVWVTALWGLDWHVLLCRQVWKIGYTRTVLSAYKYMYVTLLTLILW